MKLPKLLIIIFLFSNLLASNINLTNEENIYLSKKEKIKICVLPNWLPYEQIDQNIEHKGIGADIINIISKKLNKEFVLVPTKVWAESLQNIRNRKCDVLPVAMDVPSRKDSMNFTKPYVSEPFVVATRSDKFYIRNIDELSNEKIGIVKSYAMIEVLKSQNPLIEIIEVKNTKEGLEKVSKGEIFGYIDSMPTIGYFIQKHGFFDLKIAGKLSSSIDLSIASRNDEPLLNEILQKALNTISEEEIRSLVGRWIKIQVQQEFNYRKFFYVIGFFMIIVLVILYKNRSIKNINEKLERINKKLKKANLEVLEQQNMVDKHVMIFTIDISGVITNVNSAYCKKTGFKKEELIGFDNKLKNKKNVLGEKSDELWKDITKNKTWQGEIKNTTKSGDRIYFYMVIEPLFKENKKVGYRAICKDVTDKKIVEKLSITDSLTGLYNRLKIDQLLEYQISLFKRYKTPFSIILLDIDNFKLVNDDHGHDIGDIVLKKISNNLKKNIRKTDLIGRWGGEEFLIICQNTSAYNAYILAENVRKSVEDMNFDKCGKQTVSLGVTEYKNDSIKSLFKRVDTCLYTAKKLGKNQTKLDKNLEPPKGVPNS